jgi:hypothetical protein
LARGDTQREFAEAAAQDGIVLVPQSVGWLNQRGHFGIVGFEGEPELIAAAGTWLEGIFLALGGDLEALTAGRMTSLPGDFLHEPTGTLIEIDVEPAPS